jgi:hypothetical protein
MFNPKSSISIGAKVEISPKGFTLRVKAEIEKTTFQSAPNKFDGIILFFSSLGANTWP